MNNRRQISEDKILALLGLLKDTQVQYPPDLLAARRDEFNNRVNASNIGGASGGIPSQFFGMSAHTFELVLQYLLAGMIALLVATLAYVYQDELRQLFTADATPTVQMMIETVPPQSDSSDGISTDSEPTATATLQPTPTLVTSTPDPDADDQNGTGGQDADPKDHPGLHLGQTKTPK